MFLLLLSLKHQQVLPDIWLLSPVIITVIVPIDSFQTETTCQELPFLFLGEKKMDMSQEPAQKQMAN